MLERVTGPECPECGCEDCTPLELAGWGGWGRGKRRRMRCNHCEKVFSAPESDLDRAGNDGAALLPCVVYVPVFCPGCRSKETKVTSNRGHGVRYHKCIDCGSPFKSVEQSTPN